MSLETNGHLPPDIIGEKEKVKLTREEVLARTEAGEALQNCDLRQVDLSGLDLDGQDFSGSDIRGVKFFDEKLETGANIRNTKWMDVVVAETDGGADFRQVDAEGAVFGFTDDLINVRERNRQRHAENGQVPTEIEINAYYLFWGKEANFKKTKWNNIDFGGGEGGMEISFTRADLSEAEFDGCDFSDVDLSTATLEGIKIIRPVTLERMKIHVSQVRTIVSAIDLQDNELMQDFFLDVEDLGEKEALEKFFDIEIVDS